MFLAGLLVVCSKLGTDDNSVALSVGVSLLLCALLVSLPEYLRMLSTSRSNRQPIVSSIPGYLIERLKEEAKDASKHAYCEYSEFAVGAAVLTGDDVGTIFSGCNVENASYGLTICAERNAIFQMVAKGKKSIKALVIYTPSLKPSAPCGACRQVINEFGPDALIVSFCDGPEVLQKKLSEFLPDAFGPANLI